MMTGIDYCHRSLTAKCSGVLETGLRTIANMLTGARIIVAVGQDGEQPLVNIL